MWKFKNLMIKRSFYNLYITYNITTISSWFPIQNSCFWQDMWMIMFFDALSSSTCSQARPGSMFLKGPSKNTTPNQLSLHENHENRNEMANVPSPTSKTSNKAFWIETDGSKILGPYFWFRGMSWSRRVEHQTILKHRFFFSLKNSTPYKDLVLVRLQKLQNQWFHLWRHVAEDTLRLQGFPVEIFRLEGWACSEKHGDWVGKSPFQ